MIFHFVCLSRIMIKEKYTVKPLVQSPPKRPQFCKIHEGGLDKGYKISLQFLLKMSENINIIKMITKIWN